MTRRIQLVLTPEDQERLEAVQTASEASSAAEVYRRALKVYKVFCDNGMGTGRVWVVRRDGSKALVVD